MQPESLVQLVGSGNTATVEAEWTRLVESAEATPALLRTYQPVLAELCRVGKNALAEEWAWMAVEAMSTRLSPAETLSLAAGFLLAVGDSKELRQQVAELYRAAYAGVEGLDALLTESGLAGGRPVRRALRTLEVCLSLKEGAFIASRDQDEAGRVTKVDHTTWHFTVEHDGTVESLGAVELADRFRPAEADEVRVLRHFAPDKLRERLEQDPVAVVIDLCRHRGGSMSSELLESILSPELLSEDEFKKWCTRARTALKKCPNVQVEGRSPYTITYIETPVAHDQALVREFEKLREPMAQLQLVEKYIRDCKARGEAPSGEAVHACFEKARGHARQMESKHASRAGLGWAVAGQIGQLAGATEPWKGLLEFMRTASHPSTVLKAIDDPALFDRACDLFVETHPEWQEVLGTMLPALDAELCDDVAGRLAKTGWTAAQFDTVAQRILSTPAAHFEALLWLWDGRSLESIGLQVSALTVLTRILRVLDEARRGDSIDKERAKVISTRARTAFSARRYERFVRCLQGLDPGMAAALRTQIFQLDNLGRAVREDLLSHLKTQFPSKEVKPQQQPWMREDVLYVTAAAMEKKRADIEQHVNVKMRDNARAIGAAAERGDLSENSEYKFALEERDLLRARLAQMNAEMAIARVLNPGDVPTDHVGIGTRVAFERIDDGNRYELTIVGPWDADHERNWYNYKTPLAQGILGKRVGDVVEFEHTASPGAYRIVEISNALLAASPAQAAL